MSAVAAAAGRGSGRLSVANMAQKRVIEVHVDRHYSSKVYTSGSTISGHVEVHAQSDIDFTEFEIAFLGIASTRLDFVQQYATRTIRPFMKLRMPIPESNLPNPQTFEAGHTYIIPFNFVVPHQLTINACGHKVDSPAVRDQHLRLPPSVGNWEGDDLAPDMAKIQYSIRARAARPAASGPNKINLMEHNFLLKVLPALPEDAPLDVSALDQYYKLSKTKTLRKGLFSGKMGKLTVTSAQPGAIMLSPDFAQASTSTARLNIEFAPSSPEVAAPKINSVSGKVISTTFFSGTTANSLPNLGSARNHYGTPSLNYTSSNSLFSQPVEAASWTQFDLKNRRRDSGYSTASGLDESESDASAGRRRRGSWSKPAKKCSLRYSTAIEMPFSLPVPTTSKKAYLPTFHNCLISRVYTLQLTLSVGPLNSAMSVMVPLQVGVETIYEPAGPELPSFESAVAEAEAEEADLATFLQPRLFRPPPDMPQRNSLLPSYEDYGRRPFRTTRPVSVA